MRGSTEALLFRNSLGTLIGGFSPLLSRIFRVRVLKRDKSRGRAVFKNFIQEGRSGHEKEGYIVPANEAAAVRRWGSTKEGRSKEGGAGLPPKCTPA